MKTNADCGMRIAECCPGVALALTILFAVLAFSPMQVQAQVNDSNTVDNTVDRQLLEVSPEVLDAEVARVVAIAEASRASVGVFGPGGKGGGSGVVISADGLALTNYHVVQGNGPFMQCSMPDGVLYDAVIVGIDPVGDVAMIQLLGRDDFPFAELGDSDEVRQGEWCFAVGNPFLLATDFQPTVSYGIVSGTHRYQYPSGTLLEYADCIQTDAAINPGNSGGPLFNSRGQLIGINGRGSFEKRGRVNVGVGYAISINQIKLFHDHLLSGRIVDHATLGATVGTNESGEVRVTDILESSDAFQQGLRFDDRVTSFAGRDIRTVNQFKNVLGIFPRGWKVPLSFERDGVTTEIVVRLSGVHADESLAAMIGGVPEPEIVPPEKDNEGEDDSGDELLDAEHQHWYVERPGFANFRFNELSQESIWTQFQSNGDFRTGDNKWRITATDADGETLVFVLSDEQSGLQIGDQTWMFSNDDDLAGQLDAGNTNMLLALHLWRRMLTQGPKNYGDTFHFGGLPVTNIVGAESNSADSNRDGNAAETTDQNYDGDAPGDRPVLRRIVTPLTANVLQSTFDVTESRFFFEKSTGTLLLIEIFPDVDAAAVELYFSDYQKHDDLTVPGTIHVANGNRELQRITIERFEFLNNADE